MKTSKVQLSDLAQEALTAYKIIQYIRAFNPNHNRFKDTPTLTFKQELIDNHIIDLKVITRNNFNKVMKIFTLKHNFDPSVPFLDFSGIHYQLMENIQTHQYYPTETTKTLFNIMLNTKRKSIILGKFGLTKNIVTYLLWHLSAIIIDFRILEDATILQPFINMDKFLSIPKILYYELRDEEESKVIQHIQNQYLDIDFNWKTQKLMKFCSKLQNKNNQKGIDITYIVLSPQILPDQLLSQLKKMKINGEHQSKIISNAYKLLSNDKQVSIRPQFLHKEQFGQVKLTYQIDQFRPEQYLDIGRSRRTRSVCNFVQNKEFCTSSDSIINYQRTYFLLRKRQAYENNSGQRKNRQKWKIGKVRNVIKELCLLMHDDESLLEGFEDQLKLISKLSKQQSESFSLLQSHFIQRSLNHSITRNQFSIQLPRRQHSYYFYFQTQHVTNDLNFRLETMKKYITLAIHTKEQFVRQFRIIIHHLMSCYPQKFMFLVNRQPLQIMTEHKSTFLAINKDQNIINLETHLNRLLLKIVRLGKPPFYISASSSISSENSCFDHVLLKWDFQQQQYDMKIIEWIFSDKIEDFWTQTSAIELEQQMKPQYTIIVDVNRKVPILQRVIDIQRKVQTDLNLKREHFVICPQQVINALKANKQIKKYFAFGSRKWKVTLAAIEDVRLSDFNFQEGYLTSIVNQLFENITLVKGQSEGKKK